MRVLDKLRPSSWERSFKLKPVTASACANISATDGQRQSAPGAATGGEQAITRATVRKGAPLFALDPTWGVARAVTPMPLLHQANLTSKSVKITQ